MIVTDPLDWIDDNEKYAFVGIAVQFEGTLPSHNVTTNLFALVTTNFSVPQNSREWLGSIRTEEIEACNLFLLSKLASASPGVLDSENEALRQRVWHFYVGLLLSSSFASAHDPILITGARLNGKVTIRQQQNLDSPISSPFQPYPAILPNEISLAAQLGENLEKITAANIAGGHWRLFRILTVYREARAMPDILDRIHQYCRCIDGLILPEPGKTKQQFKNRTELFVGTAHHDLMGELYDVRSAVEHLHENRYLEIFDREVRLDLIRKEAIVEYISRRAIAKVIENETLWRHFGNTKALKAFWVLPPDERGRIWGEIIDPLIAVKDFDPRHVHNGILGS